MIRLTMSAALAISAIIAAPAYGQTISGTLAQPTNPQIDYSAFSLLTQKLESYRSQRLVTLDEFNQKSRQENAIILDSRSAAAFQAGHIEGAINLPFSDFTDEKLRKIIGDNSRPILIYCNNNFRDNAFPIALKRRPLALNIPTFINLYGYGYENIYELNDVVKTSDERLNWVRFGADG